MYSCVFSFIRIATEDDLVSVNRMKQILLLLEVRF